MHVSKGDRLVIHGRFVGQQDRVVEIVEVLGPKGAPPYRVRDESGHETIMSPGPDSVVDHRKATDKIYLFAVGSFIGLSADDDCACAWLSDSRRLADNSVHHHCADDTSELRAAFGHRPCSHSLDARCGPRHRPGASAGPPA